MAARPLIRSFVDADTPAVRDLFVRVNRDLAPDHMREAFDAYVAHSLREEIDRIADYYRERDGGFFIYRLHKSRKPIENQTTGSRPARAFTFGLDFNIDFWNRNTIHHHQDHPQ